MPIIHFDFEKFKSGKYFACNRYGMVCLGIDIVLDSAYPLIGRCPSCASPRFTIHGRYLGDLEDDRDLFMVEGSELTFDLNGVHRFIYDEERLYAFYVGDINIYIWIYENEDLLKKLHKALLNYESNTI